MVRLPVPSPILCLLALPLAASTLFCPGDGAQAATWVVRPDGTGDVPTIQAAIDSAATGDVVELLEGTFTGTGNRNIDLLGKEITIRSHYGDPRNCVIDCQQAARGFVIQTHEGPGTVLEGFSILNGLPSAAGSLVYLHECSPTFRRCIFGGGNGSFGGAVYT